ncbi:MAG TPA: hypothetical protein VFY39_10185 [Gammaproteobacteria bacterium]|nr:hypothetical protein [Gammaproteobacteria bacterium]
MNEPLADDAAPKDDSPTDELPVLTEVDVVAGLENARSPKESRDAQIALLADKDATIASLRERLDATRRAVVRRDRTEAALRAELALLTERQRALSGELAQAGERIAALEREADEQTRELESAQKRVAELESELAAIHARPLDISELETARARHD